MQVPQTGSSSLGDFLVTAADGEQVLRKHTTLDEARLVYGRALRGYLVVAAVRHPIEQIIASYYKLRLDPRHLRERDLPEFTRERLEWAQADDSTLDGYITKYVRRVYAPVYVRSARRADVVIRFENMHAGITEFFTRIGLDPDSDVPNINPTPRPDDVQLSETASARLNDLCSSYMREFGYEPLAGASPTRVQQIRRRVEYEAAILTKAVLRLRSYRILRDKASGKRPV